MKTIDPFRNDDQALTIGDLSVENGSDAVILSGSLSIRRDKKGLTAARMLAETFRAIVDRLETEDLPDELAEEEGDGGDVVANPFK